MLKIVSTAIVALALSLSFAATSDAAPTCTKGKLCGDACIAKDKECHIPPPKVCKTGKACGNTCIAKDKVCTK